MELGGGEQGDEEKRTNELDYNEEELSQGMGRARISRAEAAGLLPSEPQNAAAATAVRLP